MEPVVFDQSPLAEYLRNEGGYEQAGWAHNEPSDDMSPPSSPEFAPTGRPSVRSFRGNESRDDILTNVAPETLYRRSYSTAVASRIDRADNSKFLEQFRYTIIASQLLSGQSILSKHSLSFYPVNATNGGDPSEKVLHSTGVVVVILGALVLAVSVNWLAGTGPLNKRRAAIILLVVVIAAGVAHVFMRRQWLRYKRLQALSEVNAFVSNSQYLDSATGATIALVQEVELVSRGYRLSAPLPPITRIEDRSQTRKCVRLRKALRICLADVIQSYDHAVSVVKEFSKQLDLEKYHDIYDVSDFDISDVQQGLRMDDFEDDGSLRTLKILAARFHTIRKMFMCALLALDASGDSSDLLKWTTIVEAIRTLNKVTRKSFETLQKLLSEDESSPQPQTPKLPLTPGRERWRSQLRKLSPLSSGIRGLQAKLTLLREESDRNLDESDDISELGSNLMLQYESIGADLKMLMQAWEEGKTALALGIDRNEKRLSSMSTLLSPTSSLSGLTTVEEGGTAEALKALNGESLCSLDFSSTEEPDTEEIFEAVAQPRPRSLLTRQERITKIKEEQEKREIAKQKADANKGMMRELEMVINLRPRPRIETNPIRVVSM